MDGGLNQVSAREVKASRMMKKSVRRTFMEKGFERDRMHRRSGPNSFAARWAAGPSPHGVSAHPQHLIIFGHMGRGGVNYQRVYGDPTT